MTEALEESPVIVTSSVVIPQQSLVVPRESDAEREARRNDAAKRRRSGAYPERGDANGEVPTEPKRPRLTLEENPEFKKRGQRLFGIILGTLHRTEADNAKKSKMAEKRAETERRLQERLIREKEEIAQKIKEEKEARMTRIEKEREEMRIRSATDAREAKRSQLRDASNFLITRTSPPLYYLPSRHVESTQEMLAERKRELVVEFARIAAEEEKEKLLLQEKEAEKEKKQAEQTADQSEDAG